MPGARSGVAKQLERSHALLIAAHHLAVDQAGPHLEVVHRLDDEWVALRPVFAPAGNQPDAHGVPTSHQPEAVVLDLVNPVGAGRGLSAGDGRQGSMKLALSADKRLRSSSIDMSLI